MASDQPVGEPTPIRLNDEELIAVGALIRRDPDWTDEQKAKAVAVIGVKLTEFFMRVARTAVEHYDREKESRGE